MSFTEVFYKMYEHHKNGIAYKLSEAAQKVFDEMSDACAEYLNETYREGKLSNVNALILTIKLRIEF